MLYRRHCRNCSASTCERDGPSRQSARRCGRSSITCQFQASLWGCFVVILSFFTVAAVRERQSSNSSKFSRKRIAKWRENKSFPPDEAWLAVRHWADQWVQESHLTPGGGGASATWVHSVPLPACFAGDFHTSSASPSPPTNPASLCFRSALLPPRKRIKRGVLRDHFHVKHMKLTCYFVIIFPSFSKRFKL